MPDYLVTDPATGQQIKMTGPAPPSEALIRLALAKVQPMPSHAQTQPLLSARQGPEQTGDPMQALQGAQTIGPSRVGERYLPPTQNRGVMDVVRSVIGGAERPQSVAAQDPFGTGAYAMGAGPMPGVVAGALGDVPEGLYSRLDQAIAKLPDQKLPPMKILSTAKNATSGEEIATRGLGDFLQAAGGKPVARSEVQAHLAANPIRLETKVLGNEFNIDRELDVLHKHGFDVTSDGDFTDEPYLIHRNTGEAIEGSNYNHLPRPVQDAFKRIQSQDVASPPTKYSQYQVPGGTAYKETLITLPDKPVKVDPAGLEARKAIFEQYNPEIENITRQINNYPGTATMNRLQARRTALETARDAAADAAYIIPEGSTGARFTSSHFPGIKNPVVHVRSNERTLPSGEPGLFLEEVQSDWHQKGKASGYQQSLTPQEKELQALNAKTWQPNGSLSIADARRQRELHEAGVDATLRSKAGGVPDAPFKEQWPDLALKQQLLEASKRPDLQWLGFTSGETQAARYDLSKQISDLTLHGTGDNLRLSATDKAGRKVIDMQHTTRDGLADLIGKEPAKKLLDQPEPNIDKNPYAARNIFGADLQVGGEGMKYFYDQLLPKRLEKIVKPFGGTVERAPVATTGSAAVHDAEYLRKFPEAASKLMTPAWIVRLTPEMKSRILKEGLPLMTGAAAVAASQQEQK